MKKAGLIIALLLIFATVSGAVVAEDKDFRAGLRHYNQKDYKAAAKQFKAYVDKKPDPAAYYLLGYSLYKLNRFSEADDYFKEAYFIDPEFSLEKVGLVKKPSGEVMPVTPVQKKPESAKSPVTKTAGSAGTSAKQPEQVAKKTLPAKPVPAAPATQKPKPVPAPAPAQKQPASGQKPAPAPKPAATGPAVVPPQPTKQPPVAQSPVAAPKQIQPQQQAASLPKSAASTPAVRPPQAPGKIPGAAFPLLVGMMATFGLFIFIIAIAFYVFVSVCLYLIARRLNVPAPWTAWIPIINIYTIVAASGKPLWWIVFCFVPVVNFFVFIYLYMCITENLGKNKWLGLLMLLPLVNLGFLGWLAFSEPGSPAVTEHE